MRIRTAMSLAFFLVLTAVNMNSLRAQSGTSSALVAGYTHIFSSNLVNQFNPGASWYSVPARFGTLESTISPPTGLLGVGLGGDSSPRMIAFQGSIEF